MPSPSFLSPPPSCCPAFVLAAGVEPLFDLSAPTTGPFPSDRFTALDLHEQHPAARQPAQARLRRPGDRLRGHRRHQHAGRLQPAAAAVHPLLGTDRSGQREQRHGVPGQPGRCARRPRRTSVVGINQVVWDPATRTLHAESDELLDQHTRYLLVVTTGVKGADGQPIGREAFDDFLDDRPIAGPAGSISGSRPIASRLKLALARARLPRHHVAAASIFTTQSATAVLEKIRRQIKATTPAAGRRSSGPSRSATSGDPVVPPERLGSRRSPRRFLPMPALTVLPGASAPSPSASSRHPTGRRPQGFIPPVGTRTGVPAVQGTNTLHFNLFLPAGTAAGRRLAGRDLRPRLHRQQARRAAGRRLELRRPRHRHDRHQRRRPRRRGARHADDHPGLRAHRSRSPTAGAASTRTATARSTRPRASTRSRRAPSSATATACARPSPTSCSWCGSSRRAAFRA